MRKRYNERSAGGVVFKKEGDKIWWLVVKILGKDRNRRRLDERNRQRVLYKFPKGHVEDESVRKAAVREVEEEGQVKAKIIDKLLDNDYIYWDEEKKKKIVKKVTFFLMEYQSPSRLKHDDNELVAERLWLTWRQARKRLSYRSEKKVLERAESKMADEVMKLVGKYKNRKKMKGE